MKLGLMQVIVKVLQPVALITDNKLEVTTTAANQYVKDSFGATLHAAYTVSLDLDLITATTLKIIATDISGVEYPNSVIVNSSGNYSLEFTPTISAVSTIKVINLTAGTSRFKMDNVVIDKVTQISTNKHSYTKGSRNFELSNHLGNVMSVVTDKKTSATGTVISAEYFNQGASNDWFTGGTYEYSTADANLKISSTLNNAWGVNKNMTTIQGHQYEVRFDASDCEGSSTQWAISAKDEVNGTWYPATYFTTGAIVWSFTATSNTTRIKFQLSDGAYVSEQITPTYICLDNVLINDLDLAHYEADVISYSDYYPFGSLMPGRNASSGDYRYGFNGMEKDDEVKGSTGSSYTTTWRQYDPRIARFMSVDPMALHYSWQSPYVALDNNPIWFIDPNGDKAVNAHEKSKNKLEGDVASKTTELEKMTDSPVGKKEPGFKEYKQAVKKIRSELKGLKSALSREKDLYNRTENMLNEFAYYDPDNYKKINDLTHDGVIVDVFFSTDENLNFQVDADAMGGHFGSSQVDGTVYRFQDGKLSHYTINSDQGLNTVNVTIAKIYSAKTIAHEAGHVLYLVHNYVSQNAWEAANPDKFEIGGHGDGDPNGIAADEMEKNIMKLRKSKPPMPANFKRPR